ncbi:MAG: hypothetical protein J2P21_20320 [Chloracidobacterium sp.]|nr:hypothetical protein [Chloracidobacterium sp.]
MKRVTILTAVLLIALGALSQAHSFAQQQKQRTKRPAAGAKAKPTPTPDMRAEATQVAAQIKKVSNFIYIYGKVVNGLQFADEQAKNDKNDSQTSAKVQALNKENRDKLVASIEGVRADIALLAKGFEDNPRLQIQYLKVNSATGAALDAERLAAAGQYDDAGKSLVAIVERLTDAIMSMKLL